MNRNLRKLQHWSPLRSAGREQSRSLGKLPPAEAAILGLLQPQLKQPGVTRAVRKSRRLIDK
jgi:hypothetical protein